MEREAHGAQKARHTKSIGAFRASRNDAIHPPSHFFSASIVGEHGGRHVPPYLRPASSSPSTPWFRRSALSPASWWTNPRCWCRPAATWRTTGRRTSGWGEPAAEQVMGLEGLLPLGETPFLAETLRAEALPHTDWREPGDVLSVLNEAFQTEHHAEKCRSATRPEGISMERMSCSSPITARCGGWPTPALATRGGSCCTDQECDIPSPEPSVRAQRRHLRDRQAGRQRTGWQVSSRYAAVAPPSASRRASPTAA